MRQKKVPVAIIGAGPYGLALSLQCQHLGIEHILFGRLMSFWREHMPAGMFLRSRPDWHLDPQETDTLQRYAQVNGLSAAELDPIPLRCYLDYAEWIARRRRVSADEREVTRLDAAGGHFALTLSDGEVVNVDRVVVTTGFGAGAHVPPEWAGMLPDGRFAHSQDFTDLAVIDGRSCLIVGGRQSAFESAALAAEHGATEVHVVHRHPTPRFATADWSWVNPLLDRFIDDPCWYRDLATDEQEEITQRMWRIGRSQLEPWLAPRIDRPEVKLWPNSQITSCRERQDGRLLAELDTGRSLVVDQVVLATGYRPDLRRLEFLNQGTALAGVRRGDGLPTLDGHFQSTVPGLYFTSKFAVADFGHFFDFTAAARVSALIIAGHILLGYPARKDSDSHQVP
ncbi:hypothetical protein BS329_37065 [Amycolatopsis coloradensis]|uniref:Dimethylaniline monooxygenase n=1 Tax=Amycolatopsis coloradensis TaxID=76021 RepID=A0A1R0KFV3_9PSEU|nr:NAD(P)-binding domain-containing protein [Amycolatopsis coloradensis]OLZ44288.1 hypothetical protein BS329_37065 [Amycolatopsis coloradensis]